jgi:hypothetical protein
MEAGREEGTPTATTQSGQLALTQEESGVRGTFTHEGEAVAFSSRALEEGVYEVEVRLQGMTLHGLLDPANGVSALDGFTSETGADTQLLDADRALLSGLYTALNAELPSGAQAGEPARYLRRAVGLWAQQPSSVELAREVMGEEGRGYTMLCSYARCNGSNTGTCGGSYNWYSYAKHDCNKGGFSYANNQQIAQLGDHYSCSGDEYYLSGGSWVCGEPDHWYRPKVVGNCFGRCGGGCGGDTQYTLDATNHDGCVRNGHALASLYCDDQFASASDDELFAPDCY